MSPACALQEDIRPPTVTTRGPLHRHLSQNQVWEAVLGPCHTMSLPRGQKTQLTCGSPQPQKSGRRLFLCRTADSFHKEVGISFGKPLVHGGFPRGFLGTMKLSWANWSLPNVTLGEDGGASTAQAPAIPSSFRYFSGTSR